MTKRELIDALEALEAILKEALYRKAKELLE